MQSETVTLSCMVGFENDLTQMIIMARRCVTNKIHMARSEVKVTIRVYTLCIGFSETCFCLRYGW